MKKNEITIFRIEIESDFSDLEVIVREIQEALKEIDFSSPTNREKAALGSFLHSFYNGIENILSAWQKRLITMFPLENNGIEHCFAVWS